MRARPSLAIQSATMSAGRDSTVTGPACKSARTRSSMTPSGTITAAAAAARMSGAACRSRSSASARRRAAPAANRSSCQEPPPAAPTPSRRALLQLGVRWRRDGSDPKNGIKTRCRVMDERELLLLLFGDEALERDGSRHLREGGQAAHDRFGRSDRRRENVDRIGCPVGIGRQFPKGHHRFHLRTLEVERIEVETHERKQRRGQDRHEKPDHQNCPPVMAEERLDRRQLGISDLVHPARSGRSKLSNAGSTVMLKPNAIAMPRPAMTPSSATPM